jgi:hypothetical protein
MDLREIPQMMESYPQFIPRISKPVEPLKAYKRRHYHGERKNNISEKYFHSYCGSFEKGVGQGGLGEVVSYASTDCKYLVMFSLIYAWSVSFKFVYIYIGLSLLDRSSSN